MTSQKITTTLYTTEASESLKRAKMEVEVEDPSPEVAFAAIEKNEIPKPKGAEKVA